MMHLCSRWKEVSDIKAKPLDVPIRAHNAVKWSPEGPENVFSITSLLAALGLYNYFLPKLKKKKKKVFSLKLDCVFLDIDVTDKYSIFRGFQIPKVVW